MTTAALDTFGYPTDDALKAIRNWPADDPKGLAVFVRDAWSSDYGAIILDDTGKLAELSTGGWSGNESIVDALSDNAAFWALYWTSSRRGGHYKFRKGFDVSATEKVNA